MPKYWPSWESYQVYKVVVKTAVLHFNTNYIFYLKNMIFFHSFLLNGSISWFTFPLEGRGVKLYWLHGLIPPCDKVVFTSQEYHGGANRCTRQQSVVSSFRGKIPLFPVNYLSGGGAVQPTGMRRHDECLALGHKLFPQVFPSGNYNSMISPWIFVEITGREHTVSTATSSPIDHCYYQCGGRNRTNCTKSHGAPF